MPSFNYENPTNVRGDSLMTPQEKVLALARNVLIEEGPTALTTKRLAALGVPAELLVNYAADADILEAVLADLKAKIKESYAFITEDARAYLKAGSYSREISFQKMQRLLYRHAYLCLHPKNRTYVLLCVQENLLPEDCRRSLAETLYREFGSVLTQLILAGGEVKNEQKAAMMTCAAVGTICVFVQSPQFVREVFAGTTRQEPNYAVIEDMVNNYLLRAIWEETEINKPF
jgi:hypothetical protein